MFDELIEVIFDESTKTFHAFWQPPLAIGAGETKEAAIRDMREAIEFCVRSMVDSRLMEATE